MQAYKSKAMWVPGSRQEGGGRGVGLVEAVFLQFEGGEALPTGHKSPKWAGSHGRK